MLALRIGSQLLLALLPATLLHAGVASAASAGTGSSPGKDLAKVYSGSLDHHELAGGVDCSTGVDDVWRLDSFEYSLRGKLELRMGPSTLVVGRNESDSTGVSAVWAAVFPDEPAEITSSEPGHGDHATALFLRFHPRTLGELFPKKTVEGPGDPRWLVWGKRQFGHKINAGWQWDNMPVVPTESSLIFDMDTVEGDRRFYLVDTKKKSVRYEPAFAQRALPPVPPGNLDPKLALEAFDAAWKAFDTDYAMFGLRKDVNWDKLGDRYRPLARAAESEYELAGVIGLLVSHLEDLHVHVRQGNTWVPTHNRFRMTNGNYREVKSVLENPQERKDIHYGTVDGQYGYVAVFRLGGNGLSEIFDEALEALGETRGLILDLRFNGGGDELLGRRIAGRFLEDKVVYSLNQYRSGKKRTSLGKKLERACDPRGPWRYTAPVIVLQGEKTMSSAESLVLMLAQAENVTTLGHPTAGSSANPRSVEVGYGIVVNVPRWLDMDPDGNPIDRVGIAPDVGIDVTRPGQFRKSDPVFEAALGQLRATRNKKPGRAD